MNLGLRWEREYGLQEQQQLPGGRLRHQRQPIRSPPTSPASRPRGGPVRRRERQQRPRQQSEPEQVRAAHRRRLAGDAKTTIRGGYGLYWAPQFAIGSPYTPPGYTATIHLRRLQRRQRHPGRQSHQSLPDRRLPTHRNSLGDLTGIGQSLDADRSQFPLAARPPVLDRRPARNCRSASPSKSAM